MLSFNASLGSQKLPADYRRHAPEVCREIAENGFRGDFVGLQSRQFDAQLATYVCHTRDIVNKYKWNITR